MNPFEWINQISHIKQEQEEFGTYPSYMVNKGLSYFIDTVLAANMMNTYHQLDKDMQYSYLLNIVTPKKRFSKWNKKLVNDNLEIICNFYQCNEERGLEALKILTPEQVQKIKEKMKELNHD